MTFSELMQKIAIYYFLIFMFLYNLKEILKVINLILFEKLSRCKKIINVILLILYIAIFISCSFFDNESQIRVGIGLFVWGYFIEPLLFESYSFTYFKLLSEVRKNIITIFKNITITQDERN